MRVSYRTILTLIFSLVLTQVSFAELDVKFKAINIVKKITPYLPLKSGDSMTLIGVFYDGEILIYDHNLDTTFPPQNKSIVIDWLNGQTFKSACSVADLVDYIKSGGMLYYRFYYDNQLLTSIKVHRC